jgi:hypothetical protein
MFGGYLAQASQVGKRRKRRIPARKRIAFPIACGTRICETSVHGGEQERGMDDSQDTLRGPVVFLASQTPVAQQARAELVARYGDTPLSQAGVIVALGGDGFMLETLHATQAMDVPV